MPANDHEKPEGNVLAVRLSAEEATALVSELGSGWEPISATPDDTDALYWGLTANGAVVPMWWVTAEENLGFVGWNFDGYPDTWYDAGADLSLVGWRLRSRVSVVGPGGSYLPGAEEAHDLAHELGAEAFRAYPNIMKRLADPEPS